MFQLTTATKRLSKLKKRIRLVPGGTSAGKTISIEQLLIDDAQSDTKPTLTSIVSESFPHLKKGAIRDFKNIMMEHGYWKDDRWNATDSFYTLETGSVIEFFSADQPAKVRGPRRDRLFVNECNNIPYETWDQLLVRTKQYAWGDWNPTTEFWAYTELIGRRNDVDVCTLTYKDNEALDPAIVAEIESHKDNKNWWKVYGEGQLGEVEGRIYRDWNIVDDIPHMARLERRGLDFGYSQDPAAIVDVYYYDGGYILDEQLYQKGMHNSALADFIKNLSNPHTLVIADSAEPKSIDEMKMYGVNVLPTTKGAGSVTQSINFVQGKRISMTKRSVNLIREYRNYLWKTDKDGRILAVPEEGNDHALDAARYAIQSLNTNTSVTPHKPKNMLRRKYAHA
jgi:phage terminase, large subunit, PBSX family